MCSFKYWAAADKFDPVVGEIDVAAGGRPELVIGGKGNAWGEHIDASNFMARVWPHSAVLAERFWSAADLVDADAARHVNLPANKLISQPHSMVIVIDSTCNNSIYFGYCRPRLHEFRCKMVRRGIPASPIASLSYNEGGPYHVAFCRHDSDGFAYTPPVPFYEN